MTEHEARQIFINLVEKTFDRSFARGYSFHRSELVPC